LGSKAVSFALCKQRISYQENRYFTEGEEKLSMGQESSPPSTGCLGAEEREEVLLELEPVQDGLELWKR
jgi:hypothetical protein